MKVEVEINSRQIFEDSWESEKNKCIGEIRYHNKGAILEFVEKNEEQELNFKMTILEDKIITNRNNQNLVFDLKNKSKSILETPFGKINMNVTTKKINVVKLKEEIKEIHLEYVIELENGIKYNNLVDVLLSKVTDIM